MTHHITTEHLVDVADAEANQEMAEILHRKKKRKRGIRL